MSGKTHLHICLEEEGMVAEEGEEEEEETHFKKTPTVLTIMEKAARIKLIED